LNDDLELNNLYFTALSYLVFSCYMLDQIPHCFRVKSLIVGAVL